MPSKKEIETGEVPYDQDAVYSTYCRAYISGFIDGFLMQQAQYKAGYGKSICIPLGIKKDQSVLIISKYLLDNPQKLHKMDMELSYDALMEAFPCKSN